MYVLIARREFEHEHLIEEVYEVDGLRMLLTQQRDAEDRIDLWLDLSQSGYVLSEAGHGAAEDLIEEYARRGSGYRGLTNSERVQTRGDSIVMLCYKSDAQALSQRLLDIVSNSVNLDKAPGPHEVTDE
jgi:hypothetical protein